MIRLLAPIGALLLSATILLSGNGLQTTLVPLRASLESFSALSIGLMGSSYFAGFVVGCLLTARMVRRVGHIRVFAVMASAASIMPLLHVLMVDALAWWVFRAVTGFCIAGLFLVIESWLNERADNATRGTVFTTYTTLNFLAITTGQMLIIVHDPALFIPFAITSIIVSVAAIPVALTTSAEPARLAEVKLRPTHLLSVSPVGVITCLAVGLGNGAFWALGPVFAGAVGLNVAEIAIFMTVTVLGGAVSQLPFGRLSDHFDRRAVIVAVSLLSVASGLLMFFSTRSWEAAILPLAFAYGAFAFPLYALAVAHVNDVITNQSFVEISGGLLLVNGVGSVIGPLLAATTMEAVGPGGLFLYISIVHVTLAGFAYARMRRQPLPPETHSAGFVTIADPAAPLPVDLDPRADDSSAHFGDNS